MNTITIMGRLVNEPELKTTTSGTSVCSFTVAVPRRYGKDATDFIDVVSWKQTAEFVTKYFRKGEMIAITGELQTRNYEDKHGNKRKAVEVIVNNVDFCGKTEKPSETKEPTPNMSIEYDDISEDDLPF